MTNLVKVESKIEESKNWTLDDLKRELKKVQSQKCRLKKQQDKPTYEVEMAEVLKVENELKMLKDAKIEPKKQVTTLTKDEIEALTYDETVKAIKSIQSKKCIHRYNQESEEYKSAVKIEIQLKEHRDSKKPLNSNVVSKKELIDVIENLENANATKKEIFARLKELVATEEV